LTAYNWETNASNAGSDYLHNSDNYMVKDFSAADQKIPGQTVLHFQKTFGARKQYTLATVPAAGFVAAKPPPARAGGKSRPKSPEAASP
jgi:mannan endo-1,4-beta-mannosidase